VNRFRTRVWVYVLALLLVGSMVLFGTADATGNDVYGFVGLGILVAFIVGVIEFLFRLEDL
jgi:hypothetical protein